jgi:endonuclease/exonuclease/phosphatase family metal-dependent hydrolase
MPSAPPEARPHLRLATWNIEWFNALFDVNGHPLHDRERSSRYDVTRAQQLDAIAAVLRAVDPDGIVVVEAPDTNGRRSTVRALERFAGWAGLRQRRALTGFVSETEQEIAFLFDPDRLAARHDPQSGTVPRFDRQYHHDLDTDAAPEVIRFDKPPLELAVDVPGGRLRLIGAHLKSKNPRAGGDPAEEIRVAIENRRKQLAQCLWLRARVDRHLAAGDDLIVLGDFNDGPGLDEYERLFGRSGVEIVLGHDKAPALRLHDPHAAMALSSRIGVSPTTARFYLKPPGRFFQALLDFILVSPGLSARLPAWRIWHPFDDPQVSADAGLRDALLTASDHFPVTLDLPISAPD